MTPTKAFEDFFAGLLASFPAVRNRSVAELKRTCAEYFETLHEIPQTDFGRVKNQLKKNYDFFPSSKQIWTTWWEYCKQEQARQDPEKAEEQAKRGERGWIDRQWELFQSLPLPKKNFVRNLLPAGGMSEMVNKIMHIGIMRALEEGQHSKSAEWRELG